MKRDMELVRKILLTIEEETPNDFGGITRIEGYEDFVAGYHAKLLKDAGYIEGAISEHSDGITWIATGLTWKGHEFLDQARNESVWTKTKAIVSEKGGNASVEVMQALLTKVAMDWFGLS